MQGYDFLTDCYNNLSPGLQKTMRSSCLAFTTGACVLGNRPVTSFVIGSIAATMKMAMDKHDSMDEKPNASLTEKMITKAECYLLPLAAGTVAAGALGLDVTLNLSPVISQGLVLFSIISTLVTCVLIPLLGSGGYASLKALLGLLGKGNSIFDAAQTLWSAAQSGTQQFQGNTQGNVVPEGFSNNRSSSTDFIETTTNDSTKVEKFNAPTLNNEQSPKENSYEKTTSTEQLNTQHNIEKSNTNISSKTLADEFETLTTEDLNSMSVSNQDNNSWADEFMGKSEANTQSNNDYELYQQLAEEFLQEQQATYQSVDANLPGSSLFDAWNSEQHVKNNRNPTADVKSQTLNNVLYSAATAAVPTLVDEFWNWTFENAWTVIGWTAEFEQFVKT